jgi:hypothetical protein
MYRKKKSKMHVREMHSIFFVTEESETGTHISEMSRMGRSQHRARAHIQTRFFSIESEFGSHNAREHSALVVFGIVRKRALLNLSCSADSAGGQLI